MKLIHPNVGLLLAVMLLGAPMTTWAQGSTEARTYGTASNVIHMVPASAFVGEKSGDITLAAGGNRQARWCTSAAPNVTCELQAGVSLPAGAVVTSIELDACLSSIGEMQAVLRRFASNELSDSILAPLSTSEFDFVPPGCGRFQRALSSPETIDNNHNHYIVRVLIRGDGSENERLHGVRIGYHLQVSPAPATARFNDVPTNHLFFQFIEALAAAGITGGCSTTPPLYCPDDPVTRGQMAVFISRALGLHFAP